VRQEPHNNLFKVKSYMYSKSKKGKKKLYTIQQTTKVSQNPQRRLLCTKKRPPRPHPTTKVEILSRREGPLYTLA
jgi:hypothetical protein